jgi:hypothetical protein
MFGNKKTNQQKLNFGQHRKHNFNKEKCFSFDKNRKTLSFSFTHFSPWKVFDKAINNTQA